MIFLLMEVPALGEGTPNIYEEEQKKLRKQLTEEGQVEQQAASRKARDDESDAETGLLIGLGAFLAGYSMGGCSFYYSFVDGESMSRSFTERYRAKGLAASSILLMIAGVTKLYNSAGDWTDSQDRLREIQSNPSLVPQLKARLGDEGAKQFAKDFSGSLSAEKFIEKYTAAEQRETFLPKIESIRESIHDRLARRIKDPEVLRAMEETMVKERALPYILAEGTELSPSLRYLNRELESAQSEFFQSR